MSDMGREELLVWIDTDEAREDLYTQELNETCRTQLKAIVEQHFDLSYHPSAFGNNKQSPELGVDEEDIKWIDERIRDDEHWLEKAEESGGSPHQEYVENELEILKRIKQLLTRQKPQTQEGVEK